MSGPSSIFAVSGVNGVWLDAEPIGNFLGPTGAARTAYGTEYARWTDLSGSGRHVIHPTTLNALVGNMTAESATLRTAYFYEHAPIAGLGPSAGGGIYGMIAFKTAGSSYYGTIFSNRNTSKTSNNGYHVQNNSDANAFEFSIGTSNGVKTVSVTRPGQAINTSLTGNTKFVIEFRHDPATRILAIRVNGGAWQTLTLDASWTYVAGSTTASIFQRFEWLSMDMAAAVITRNHVPTTTLQDETFQYGAAAVELPQGAISSVGSPATYSHAGVAAFGARALKASVGSPATFAYSGVAAFAYLSRASVGSPGVFSHTGSDAFGAEDDLLVGESDPGTFTHVGVAAFGSIQKSPGIAEPGTYSQTGFDAVTSEGLITFSVGDPGAYGAIGFAATTGGDVTSVADPGSYFVSGLSASEPPEPASYSMHGFSGFEYIVRRASIVRQRAETDAEFLAWLESPNEYRTILVEVDGQSESTGSDVTHYLSTRGYVTGPTDLPSNIHYEPLILGGFDFTSKISLDLSGDVSWGDIQLDNSGGYLDDWFRDIWTYRPARAFIGDSRWPRSDFRVIFDGVLTDIDSANRSVINLRLRDKLARLDMPLSDTKVGGTGPDKDRLLPLCFGECHNVTPVLINQNELVYSWHAEVAEAAFEVRDNGVPITRTYLQQPPAKLVVPGNPYGQITASVQGDAGPFGGEYVNTVATIIKRMVTRFGTEISQRLTDDDIDLANFEEFDLNNPQPCGIYITDRMTVLEACQRIAASVGARLSCTPAGKLRLVKVAIPPAGDPVDIHESNMLGASFQIENRLPIVPGARLAFCKNWTVQSNLVSGIPEDHKELYAQEWLYASAINETAREATRVTAEPQDEETFLLRRIDADEEAARRVDLRSQQRHVFGFQGYAELMFLEVGGPVTVHHPRFDFAAGKTGMVVSTAIDWMNSTVRVGFIV